MNHTSLLKRTGRLDGGYVLMSTIILGVVIGAVGLAFMRWSTDEVAESGRTHAAMQAYYVAQTGVIEKGFTWLRTRLATEVPNSEIVLPGREIPNVGRYDHVRISPVIATEGGNFFSSDKVYSISAVGTVRIPFADGSDGDGFSDVERKAVLYVKLRSYTDYMYLTNSELDAFGFTVRFQAGDTLWGRVHSNWQIAIMQNPVFYDLVSSSASDFWRGVGYNPQFRGPDPVFNAPRVDFPSVAGNLRACAGSSGTFFDQDNLETTWFVDFGGSLIRIHAWPTGTPIDTAQNPHWTNVPITGDLGIFFTGPVWTRGRMAGRCTLGSEYDIRIVDNLTYVDADVNGRVQITSPNMLGVVSEKEIKIANTPANGRENCAGGGRNNPNQNLCGIIISAALVALDEQFTFENQNDGGDSGYVCSCNPDERGYIHLFGSVTQWRRGFVHRSTQGGTGYLKDYRYDARFLINRPPCFFDATDNQGRALYDVVQWGQAVEDRTDIGRRRMFRFN